VGDIIGIAMLAVGVVGLLLQYLSLPEKHQPVVRRWVAVGLVALGAIACLALSLLVRWYWALGSVVIVLIACAIKRSVQLAHLWSAWDDRWYNWRTRRRIARILREVLACGYSPLLKEIDPKKYDAHDGKCGLPYESFFYCPANLRQDSPKWKRLTNLRPTNDDGLAVLGASAVEGDGSRTCRIIGPYVKLPRSGVYLVSFRIRCRDGVGGQPVTSCEVEADVTHHKGTLYPGHWPVRVTLAPGDYASLPLLFTYREEPDVEFRLLATGDPAAAVVIDVICVVRLG